MSQDGPGRARGHADLAGDDNLVAPDWQRTDPSGNPPVGSVYFYEVTADNVRCPAEGPF